MEVVPCRNVLFDLDGTLLDSRPGIIKGLRHALGLLGHELPPTHPLDWAIGPPLALTMKELLAAFGDDRVDEAVQHYRAWYKATGMFDARPYDGVEPTLAELQRRGKSLYVASTKRNNCVRAMLAHFGLIGHFLAIQGAEPDGRFDSKTDLVRHLLTHLGLRETETAIVGDREYDLAAARANDLRAVAVTYGYGTRAELEAAGAEVFCASPPELLEFL